MQIVREEFDYETSDDNNKFNYWCLYQNHPRNVYEKSLIVFRKHKQI